MMRIRVTIEVGESRKDIEIEAEYISDLINIARMVGIELPGLDAEKLDG